MQAQKVTRYFLVARNGVVHDSERLHDECAADASVALMKFRTTDELHRTSLYVKLRACQECTMSLDLVGFWRRHADPAPSSRSNV